MLEVIRKNNNYVRLNSIIDRPCVIAYDLDDFYLLIQEIVDEHGDYINAIDLEHGKKAFIPYDEMVTVIDAEIVER